MPLTEKLGQIMDVMSGIHKTAPMADMANGSPPRLAELAHTSSSSDDSRHLVTSLGQAVLQVPPTTDAFVFPDSDFPGRRTGGGDGSWKAERVL